MVSFRAFTVAASLFATLAAATPLDTALPRAADQCNVSNQQCCNSVQQVIIFLRYSHDLCDTRNCYVGFVRARCSHLRSPWCRSSGCECPCVRQYHYFTCRLLICTCFSSGLDCSPITVIGGGNGGCNASPVCCENNSFVSLLTCTSHCKKCLRYVQGSLISIGCVPISI